MLCEFVSYGNGDVEIGSGNGSNQSVFKNLSKMIYKYWNEKYRHEGRQSESINLSNGCNFLK